MLITILCGAGSPSPVVGADAYPVFTDPNPSVPGFMFGAIRSAPFGAKYQLDNTAQLNGNAVLGIRQFGSGTGGSGVDLAVPISNGENGIDQSLDGDMGQDVNPDAPNTTPANPVFASIGNSSGKLEDGNVVRFSAWFRSDPADPISVDPQIQPVLKFEFWKEAFSTNQDTNPGRSQPFYGDKVFDQDQHGGAIGIAVPEKAQWIDFDGDGFVIDAAAQGEDRVSQISTTAWTLVESTYTVDHSTWIGIGDDHYALDDIEEVRAVMFVGDFTGTDLSGDGDGGRLLVDNVLVEVFKDAASVIPNSNPNPDTLVALFGDYNGNGVVDAADYVVWRDRVGGGGTLPNDNTPGIGQDDYNQWRTNFGRTPGLNSAGIAPVPEPAAALVVCAIAAGLLIRFRRNELLIS